MQLISAFGIAADTNFWCSSASKAAKGSKLICLSWNQELFFPASCNYYASTLLVSKIMVLLINRTQHKKYYTFQTPAFNSSKTLQEHIARRMGEITCEFMVASKICSLRN
jgi:hypothetical protein